jgi:uncharacterized protein (TIGR04255 family)
MGPTPTYAKPPVEEVALAVSFAPLNVATFELTELAARWKVGYPELIDQLELPPSPLEQERGSSMVLRVGPPGRRFWFRNAERQRLVQLQADRLVLNWARAGTEAPYPSYPTLKPELFKLFGELQGHLGDSTQLAVEQAEVTYVNPIAMPFAELIEGWTGATSSSAIGEPEDVGIVARFRIVDDGAWRGRLTLQADPVLMDSGERACLLQSVARVPTGLDGLEDAMDLAHVWAVNGFDAFTSRRAHEIWEKHS